MLIHSRLDVQPQSTLVIDVFRDFGVITSGGKAGRQKHRYERSCASTRTATIFDVGELLLWAHPACVSCRTGTHCIQYMGCRQYTTYILHTLQTILNTPHALHTIQKLQALHTLHYITLHYITLHYVTLHYITLHYLALACITLHCIIALITPHIYQHANLLVVYF